MEKIGFKFWLYIRINWEVFKKRLILNFIYDNCGFVDEGWGLEI